MKLIWKHMYACKISLWIIHLYLNNLGWDSLLFRARKNSPHPIISMRWVAAIFWRVWRIHGTACSDKLQCTCTLMDLGCHFTSFPPLDSSHQSERKCNDNLLRDYIISVRDSPWRLNKAGQLLVTQLSNSFHHGAFEFSTEVPFLRFSALLH